MKRLIFVAFLGVVLIWATELASGGRRGGGGGGRGGGRGGGNGNLGDPGLFRTRCVTVRFLVQTAYVYYANGQERPASQLKNQPVEGGLGWIDTERFIINAKPETQQTKAIMGGPQALLEERFKLKIHRETRKVPAYALAVAKGGVKLQATPEGGCATGESSIPPELHSSAME